MQVRPPREASAIYDPEMYLYELINVLPEAAFLVSEGGELLAANPPARRMLEVGVDGLGGKRLHELTTEFPERVEGYLGACLTADFSTDDPPCMTRMFGLIEGTSEWF